MMTITETRAMQMELDLETDNARLDRLDWQRAIDRNLHALRDYVKPNQLLIWQPGVRKRGGGVDAGYKAFDVQLTTTSRCTCSRFKLRDRCEHIALAKEIAAAGIELDTETPVRAGDIHKEVAA